MITIHSLFQVNIKSLKIMFIINQSKYFILSREQSILDYLKFYNILNRHTHQTMSAAHNIQAQGIFSILN